MTGMAPLQHTSPRVRRLVAIAVVGLIALGLRLYAVPRLNVDYDEPVYLSAAVEYAQAMRTGDLKMLAWSEHTYEHPALQKILYGVVLLTQPEIDRLPENDLPRLAPIADTEAGRWNIAARYLALAWGTLAVLALALLNPLAGLFLAVSTLSVKYTSEVYLEALPLLTGLLCAMAYLRWFTLMRQASKRRHPPSAVARPSALLLGMTAAGKYVHAVVGIAIVVHFAAGTAAPANCRTRASCTLAGWGSPLAAAVLDIRPVPVAASHRPAGQVDCVPPGFSGFAPGRDVLVSVLAAAALALSLRRLLRASGLPAPSLSTSTRSFSSPPCSDCPGYSANKASSSSGSWSGLPSC